MSGHSKFANIKHKKEKNDGKDKNVLVDSVKGTVEEIKKDRNLLFAAIAGACSVLLVVLVVVLVMIGTKYLSPSYRVINQYMKGCQEMDVDSHMDLYHEDVIEVYESEGDYDFEEIVESMFEDWEEIKDALYKADQILSNNEINLLSATKECMHTLQGLSHVYPTSQEWYNRLDSCYIELKDLSHEIADANEDIEFNPTVKIETY